jgi:hypothetical protein
MGYTIFRLDGVQIKRPNFCSLFTKTLITVHKNFDHFGTPLAQMLPDEHLCILLDVIVDWCEVCIMVTLLEFYHCHLFCNSKVVNKEVRSITTL